MQVVVANISSMS